MTKRQKVKLVYFCAGLIRVTILLIDIYLLFGDSFKENNMHSQCDNSVKTARAVEISALFLQFAGFFFP